jgi:Sulfotransferase domain
MRQRQPNFIGIGAIKSATTWMWHQLDAHPEIKFPALKEFHYFDLLATTPEHYLHRFSLMPDEYKTGEATPAYMGVPHAPIVARAICPEVKLWAILRNPADRAFSHWKVGVWTEGKIPAEISFMKAFIEGYPHSQHGSWHSLKERGLYYKHLKRWYQYFPKEQLKVFLYDDILSDPVKVLQSMYRYLEVDDKFVPPNYKQWRNKNWSGQTIEFKQKDRKKVLEFYKPSIARLEKLLNKDLSKWQ